MKTLYFKEVQKFKQFWLWLIVLGVAGLCVGVPAGMYLKGAGESGSMSLLQLAGYSLLGWLPVVLLFVSRMETEITPDGISYRLFPFQIKFRKIAWNEIESAEVRTYRPLAEYGGWGLRFSFGNGRAINMSGNQGLQLVLKNGKKLLLGTHKSEEIAELLRQIERNT